MQTAQLKLPIASQIWLEACQLLWRLEQFSTCCLGDLWQLHFDFYVGIDLLLRDVLNVGDHLILFCGSCDLGVDRDSITYVVCRRSEP